MATEIEHWSLHPTLVDFQNYMRGVINLIEGVSGPPVRYDLELTPTSMISIKILSNFYKEYPAEIRLLNHIPVDLDSVCLSQIDRIGDGTRLAFCTGKVHQFSKEFHDSRFNFFLGMVPIKVIRIFGLHETY